MKRIFTLIVLIILTILSCYSQDEKDYVNKQAFNIIEQYETYFNFIGDINEPFADRKRSYSNSFIKLFTSEDAYVYNDLNPEKDKTAEIEVSKYVIDIIASYTATGIRTELDLMNVNYGDIIPTGSKNYYMNVVIDKMTSGYYMEKTLHRETNKLEFRIAFDKPGMDYSNFKIAGIRLYTGIKNATTQHGAKKVSQNNEPDIISENNNSKAEYASNSGIFKDARDGREYKWVRIGNQIWMAENLEYKTRQYTWNTALNVCPIGWHLPSKEEWKQLMNYLGGKKEAMIKLISSSAWMYKYAGTNSSGFNALPQFRIGGNYPEAYWWTSTGNIFNTARSVEFRVGISFLSIDIDDKCAVRCIKN